MGDTIIGGKLGKEESERIAKWEEMEHIARSVHPELTQAVRNLLAALRYRDDQLVESTENSVYEVFATVARDIAQKEIEVSVLVKTGLQKAWGDVVDGVIGENFDGIRRKCLSFIDERITSMTGVRDEIVNPLEGEGYPVENRQELEQAINDLRQFKENLLKDWPDSERPPAPINRQVIDEAKKSISQQDKWMTRKDLVHPKKTE